MDAFSIHNYSQLVIISHKTQELPIDYQSGDHQFVLFNTTNLFSSVNSKNEIDLHFLSAIELESYPDHLSVHMIRIRLQFDLHFLSAIELESYPDHMYRKMMSIDIRGRIGMSHRIRDH